MRTSSALPVASVLTACTLMIAVADPAHAADPPPRADESVATSDGGFVLHQPKWKKAGAGANVGLTAKFKWGGAGERSALVSDSVGYWQLVFPDRPKPDEAATLVLSFEFALTDEDKRIAREAVVKAIDQAVALVERSALEADAALPGATPAIFREEVARRVRVGSKVVVGTLDPLHELRTPDGKNGDEVVLETIGFHKTSSGEWELPDLVIDKLREHARLRGRLTIAQLHDIDTSLSDRLKKTVPRPYETSPEPCRSAVAKALDGKDDGLDGLKKCGALLVVSWKAEIPTRKAAAPAADAKKYDDLSASIDRFAAALPNVTAADVNAVPDTGDTTFFTVTTQPVISQAEKIDAPSYSVLAVKYLRNKIALANAEAHYRSEAIAPIVDKLSTRVTTMTQEQVGVALLEQGADKRLYQAATGVVYVAKLDQFIMPLMMSYCLVDGCLRRGKTIFDGGQVKHLVSVDLGVRAKTIGDSDPRDNGTIGFLVGISLNPLLFARLSAGAYVFENSQTTRWNSVPYIGVSADLLHAVELLGVTGLGVPQAPQVTSVAAAPASSAKKGP